MATKKKRPIIGQTGFPCNRPWTGKLVNGNDNGKQQLSIADRRTESTIVDMGPASTLGRAKRRTPARWKTEPSHSCHDNKAAAPLHTCTVGSGNSEQLAIHFWCKKFGNYLRPTCTSNVDHLLPCSCPMHAPSALEPQILELVRPTS